VCGGLYHDMDYARLELLKLLGEHERIRMRVGGGLSRQRYHRGADFLVTYTCDVIPQASEQEALGRFLARGGVGSRCMARTRCCAT
jgi:hypothetical protein